MKLVLDCTQALAQEVSLLKDRCRHLEKQLEGAFVASRAPPTEEQAPTASGSTQLQDQGLNRGIFNCFNNISMSSRVAGENFHFLQEILLQLYYPYMNSSNMV
ncbi:MAG: hypothetical protein ATN33_01310 [Epulopiscium sp. Nele67-Bin001]|nr:MAG: hypothetical protein ATN33_01310 [Epulopiscium sp. Nele67-Bin001]